MGISADAASLLPLLPSCIVRAWDIREIGAVEELWCGLPLVSLGFTMRAGAW